MLCPLCQFDNPAQSTRCRACGAPLKTRPNQSGAASDALPNGTLLIGTYAVEDVLGQGGFGITYRCHDQMLDRRVAVKEFFPSGCRRQEAEVAASRGLSDADFRAARTQFLAEARVLARCHHAGIVGVHAAFEANQTAYMVMELLHGKTLAQLLSARGGCMNEAEAVGIIERVGEALQFVHEQNLLHRDIKPDNIIVCDDGRVMLIDFGTARETIQGQVQGQTVVVTPGYAPLEQYAKQAKRGAFTDVYSLAATLYHLLTGQMPPAASDRAMGVMLRPVREFNPKISASVAHATQSALQMEIAKRPQSVREFLDLLGAPVENSKSEISPVLQSVIRRRDLLHSEDAEIEALFSPNHPLKGTQPPSVSLFSDALQEGQTLLGNLLSNASEDSSEPRFNSSVVALFSDALQDHQTLLGNLPIANAQPVQLAPPRAFSTATTPPSSATISHLSSGGVRVKNSADSGKSERISWWALMFFVGVLGLLFLLNSAGKQRAATSPSSANNPVVVPLSSRSNSYVPSMSQNDLKRQAAGREWDKIRVLRPTSVQTLPVSPNADKKSSFGSRPSVLYWRNRVEFSPDGKRLATIDKQSVLRVLSLPDRRVVRSLALDKSRDSVDAVFSTDNGTIAVTQNRKPEQGDQYEISDRVEVWSLRSGKRLGTFATDAPKDSVSPQAILNDGQVLLRQRSSGSEETKLFLWNPKTGKRSDAPIADVAGWIYSAMSPDGKEFIVGDRKGGLHWLDWRSGKQKAERPTQLTLTDFRTRFDTTNYTSSKGDSEPLSVTGLDYSLNGSYLAVRNVAQIRVFDSKTREVGSLTFDGRGSLSSSPSLAVSPDGKWVAAAGALPYGPAGKLLWNVKTGQKIRLGVPSETLLDFGFSPDGKELYGIFARGEQFQFVTWRVGAPTVAPFANAREASFRPANMSFHPLAPVAQSGELVAIPVRPSIEIRQQNGSLIRTLNVGAPNVAALRFSLGGQFLALRKDDGAIQVWDVELGKSVVQSGAGNPVVQGERSPFGRRKNPPDLAFSPDNKFFACERSAGDSSVVELWSIQDKPRRLASFAQKEPMNAVAFSPDSKGLICGGDKGLVQWIDVATKQPLFRIRANEPVLDVAGTAQSLAVVGASNVTLYRVSPNSKNQSRQIAQTKISERPSAMGTPFSQWAISADGKLLATAARRGPVQIWHLPTESLLQSLDDERNGMGEFPPLEICGLEFLPMAINSPV